MLLMLLCPRLEGSAVRLLHVISILRNGREVKIDLFLQREKIVVKVKM